MSDTHTDELTPPGSMRVNRFDQVSSLLMTLLLFFGVFVLLMLLLWLFERLEFKGQKLVVVPVEEPAGRGANAAGEERDFEPPAAEEVEDLLEPTLEETITAVTDAVTSVAAAVDTMSLNQGTVSKGDSRPPGPEGEGENIVPRFERWQLKFTAKSLTGYATQLDHFGIELAAIGGQPGVDYAFDFVGSPKKRRGAGGESEQRLYFRWTDVTEFTEYDRQLLQQAGVPLSGRIVLMFISKELEEQLYQREMAYAQEKGYDHPRYIASTVFEVQPVRGGFEFVVIDQRYREV